jgi:hypothetical protein
LLGTIVLAAALYAAPARAADPLTMFLLGWVKNIIESQIEEAAQKRPPAPVQSVAPTMPSPIMPALPAKVTEGDLRALVDDGFAYLSSAQRKELLEHVEKALSDPANGPYREEILAQFANVARQAGFTLRQLDRLSTQDKRVLAQQFAANFHQLAPDQQQDLLERLRGRALPLPSDLNEMMLTALASAG